VTQPAGPNGLRRISAAVAGTSVRIGRLAVLAPQTNQTEAKAVPATSAAGPSAHFFRVLAFSHERPALYDLAR
jgi:hypothetical protein